MSERTRILLVEDNPADARLIQEGLDSKKYDLKTVDRLSKALAYFQNNEADIILADLSLPDSEFTNTIFELHSHVPHIPIIALTGLSDKKLALEALKVGAQDYLVKGGFDTSELEQRIAYSIERKKAEETQSQQRFKIVQQVISSAKQDIHRTDPKNIFFRCVEDCNEAIMILDNFTRLIYVNPMWERIYGYTSKEIIGQTTSFLQPQTEDYYQAFQNQIAEAKAKRYWRGEVIHRAKDGRDISVLLTIAPSETVTGENIGFMAIALDMTTQKELETKIFRQEHLASIGILASGLAHEIGTPLGVIRGHAEFLEPMAKDQTQLREGLETIISQIDRITTLVSSLLQLSRGTSDITLSDINIRGVLNEVILLLQGNFNKLSIKFTMDIPEHISAYSNSHKLQQIFINLLINSIHAIEEVVKTGRRENHTIKVAAQTEDGKVKISITDTGCGISNEVQKKLFQPFFTTKDIGKGTGLGLAIVYNVVAEMGGEIRVNSHVNEFTTFLISLKANR
ncbi:MAG: ATP-binding protein [Oligoflexia bacterium]|nr:ATP-binding protein [Oligoflexia bacterium]